jgi:predicted membrane protein
VFRRTLRRFAFSTVSFVEALYKAGIINWKPTQVSESVVTLSVYHAGLETLVEDVARVRRSRLRSLFAEFPTRPPRRWCVLGIGTSCSSAWT